MRFSSEKEMNVIVRQLIEMKVIPNLKEEYKILNSDKSFDIPICKEGSNPKLLFLELKCYQKNHGRLGVGHGKGGGFQIEILTNKTDYFELYLKWLISFPEKYPEKYLLLESSDIRKYASGGAIGEKFNNIKLSIFQEEELFTEDEIISKLIDWLDSN